MFQWLVTTSMCSYYVNASNKFLAREIAESMLEDGEYIKSIE
jgi:hypothetical protein